MDTLDRLMEISSRIEHLENAAEWIARETVHTDNGLSQTGTLISVLAEDVRERVYSLIRELELTNTIETETFH
jgi:hypothetical protein